MEGENGEAKIIKKEKKQKRGQICSPEIQICAAENGSQAKIKKKRKKVETVAKEKEEKADQKKDKKKAKRKKRDDVSSTIETDDGDKRKKKPAGDGVIQAENFTVKAGKLEKKKRKEEKLKEKCVQIKPENMKVEKDEEMPIRSNDRKKPKKGKGKDLASRTAETKELVVEKKKKTPVITNGVGETKAKKKAKLLENGIKVEKEETEVSKVKLKRKKEKESKSEGNEIKAKRKKSTEDEEILPKKKNKLKNKEISVEEDVSEVKSKKKNKSKKAKKEDGNVEAEEMEPQKKKRKRVKEEEGVEDGVALAAEPQSKKSKRKKNSAKDGQDVNTEAKATRKKKKKNKEEQEDSQDFPKGDVVFLSAKPGNSDEVAINQERRKALQMEIEEASQPDKPAVLGQWSTAQFDSSQQQQKFLRLMGGFKKGFQPAGAAAGGANMALGKDAQQQLQQGLLGQFERAHARKMDFSNRGAGLGFTAPSNKKFSIDINASRSVRFDD
ncbi:PREDICTED: lysine-rich nucleolar protein 1 [Poecilia mexicana]|uniref:Small acidic protein-like domain-containing protein n=1 Tax=Poecilia mexicana TaxID=48701 RepID=A0A3B3YQM5_9TELE|nr:PREDICTED: lysine-rich nucleolar protein 1 [Poecilia mexicana]XP_014830315.1 PREDICTED: lysine-rich nucleolar protein 1 [Poecilia mexicana]